MTYVDTYTHSFPGTLIALHYAAEDRLLMPTEEFDLVLDALAAWQSLIEPLAMDLALACCDYNGFEVSHALPQPYWHIRRAALPPQVLISPMRIGEARTDVADLAPSTLYTWARAALDQACGEAGLHTRWMSLDIRAVKARILATDHLSQRDTITVRADMGDVVVPLHRREGEIWVAGPIAPLSTEPPLSMQFRSDEGRVDCELFVKWDLWDTPGSPELAALQEGVAVLTTRRWQLDAAPWLDDLL